MSLRIILIGLLIACLLTFLSPFASKAPDGLEKVAEKLGFIHKEAENPPLKSPFPDYSIPAVKNESASTILAGFSGMIATFGVTMGLGYLLKRRKR